MNVLCYVRWTHSGYCTDDDNRRTILWNLLNSRLPTASILQLALIRKFVTRIAFVLNKVRVRNGRTLS